jgi:PTH1 family peptidyl-tRNA hydrolase
MLLVGLGNPGASYKHTRHNVGFLIIDEIIRKYDFPSPKQKFNAELNQGEIAGKKIFTLKPMSYMNNSGIPVAECMRFYKIALEDVIVFHDDLDLPLARLKIKLGGGAAGHNGLRSLDKYIGNNYLRVRFGIDRPVYKDQVSDYVLHNFLSSEFEEVEISMKYIADNITDIINKRFDNFLNNYSKK